MSENGEIYTAGKNFTLPQAVTALTNSTSGRGWARGGEQLFALQEAIQMCGRPHGPHQMVPLDLRGVRQAQSLPSADEMRGNGSNE